MSLWKEGIEKVYDQDKEAVVNLVEGLIKEFTGRIKELTDRIHKLESQPRKNTNSKLTGPLTGLSRWSSCFHVWSWSAVW